MARFRRGEAAVVVRQIEESVSLKRSLIERTDTILEIANQLVQCFRH